MPCVLIMQISNCLVQTSTKELLVADFRNKQRDEID